MNFPAKLRAMFARIDILVCTLCLNAKLCLFQIVENPSFWIWLPLKCANFGIQFFCGKIQMWSKLLKRVWLLKNTYLYRVFSIKMIPNFKFSSYLQSQRIQRPRHCYFFFLPPPKKSKKWCSQQEGKLFSANPGLCWMTPEPNPPDLLMMRSATLFHQPTNNKQVARLFLRAVSS